jgi:uroporphyrinogen-III decarboxylase
VSYSQRGYPESWEGLTPDQKRQWRLANFASGEGIRFINAEAKNTYMVRAKRLVDTYNLREPDQIPVVLPLGDLPFILYGINLHMAMYDINKAVEACKEFNSKYAEELEFFASPSWLIPAKALDILGYNLYSWAGHGLPENAPGYQFLEGEYMKQDEYDNLIHDPSDFWLRIYLPRVFSAFESFNLLPALTGIFEMPIGKLEVLTNPGVKATLRKLLEVSDELEKRTPIIEEYVSIGPASGYPVMPRAALSKAPFDTLGDTLRGTANIMKDIYRRPEKILEAVEVIANVTIANILNAPNASKTVSVTFPLHKGADGWMSQKQFETFYFPTLKKVMDAVIKEGMIVTLFAEGSYNTRLESVNVFPKGAVCWHFDQTDMFRAKKILGEKCSLMGNIPSSMIVTGSYPDVKAYCRKLIDGCGRDGGYILGAGATAENPKLENLQAMVAAVKEYAASRKQGLSG